MKRAIRGRRHASLQTPAGDWLTLRPETRTRLVVAVEFRSSFSLQGPTSAIRESGADAQFPSETRHCVVVCQPPEPNGVQGVAGSNPAVPTCLFEASHAPKRVTFLFSRPGSRLRSS